MTRHLRRRAALVVLLSTAAILLVPAGTASQTRSMAQDPALDNLRHPQGLETVAPASLGRVRKVGDGPRAMLLIAGLGFGDSIWTDFMDRRRADYTMYALTLPGFGDTSPPAMPPPESRFADVPWTRSAVRAIEQLLDKERLTRVTVVAHWALATQIALQLALERPDRVESVILVSGVLKVYYENTPRMMDWTPDERSRAIESLAHQWFRTVTRRTWDDNNFMSYDYAINPRRGLFLWREAQAPSLPVWIRYTLEFYSLDLAARLKDLRVPTLVVQPGFDDPAYYVEEGRSYMRNLCVDSWRGAAAVSDRIELTTVPQSRLFIMYDRPDVLDRVIDGFLQRIRQP